MRSDLDGDESGVFSGDPYRKRETVDSECVDVCEFISHQKDPCLTGFVQCGVCPFKRAYTGVAFSGGLIHQEMTGKDIDCLFAIGCFDDGKRSFLKGFPELPCGDFEFLKSDSGCLKFLDDSQFIQHSSYQPPSINSVCGI